MASQIRYAAPASLIARKNHADACSTTARPVAASTIIAANATSRPAPPRNAVMHPCRAAPLLDRRLFGPGARLIPKQAGRKKSQAVVDMEPRGVSAHGRRRGWRGTHKSAAKKQRHALLPIVAKQAARLSWYLRYRALQSKTYTSTSRPLVHRVDEPGVLHQCVDAELDRVLDRNGVAGEFRRLPFDGFGGREHDFVRDGVGHDIAHLQSPERRRANVVDAE